MTYKALIAAAGMLALSGCVVPYDDDRRGYYDHDHDEHGYIRDDHDRDRHDDRREEHHDRDHDHD